MNNGDTDDTKYRVVVNDEEQFSIWAVDRQNPVGWRDANKSGSKTECLAYIKEVWTDMRPLSLQNEMKKPASAPVHPEVHLNGNHRKATNT
jgi:MbtH protein